MLIVHVVPKEDIDSHYEKQQRLYRGLRVLKSDPEDIATAKRDARDAATLARYETVLAVVRCCKSSPDYPAKTMEWMEFAAEAYSIRDNIRRTMKLRHFQVEAAEIANEVVFYKDIQAVRVYAPGYRMLDLYGS